MTTTMNVNVNAITPEELAEIIADNRLMAKEQLDMDHMGKTMWQQYCQLCDNVAKESWNSLNRKCDENILATSLKLLFSFFGCDAKPVPAVQKRFLLACVSIKKVSSDELKRANKVLRAAKIALEECEDENNFEQLKAEVEKAQAVVDELKATPGNYYNDLKPQFKNGKATKDCRKKIEDAMHDLLVERSLMTAEELLAEELALKMTRKANKKAKAQQKDAETITDADATK